MDIRSKEFFDINTVDRPFKIPRFEVRLTDHPDAPREISSFERLQERIRDFCRVIPTKTNTTAIIDFAQNCTESLKKKNYCYAVKDQHSATLEQLHGLLILWLNFSISSCLSCDTTTDNSFEIKAKFATVVTPICTCLEEVYKCLEVCFSTNESLHVLCKALLLLVSDPNDASTRIDCDEMVALFRVIDVSVHNGCSIPSLYTYQRFLLCVVRTNALSMQVNESLVSTLCCSTLKRLCGLTRGRQVEELNAFANVAWKTLFEPNQTVILRSSSSLEIFRFQCLLQLPSFELRQLTADNVSSLVMKVLPCYVESSNAHLQIQAIDCIVAISARGSISDYPDMLFTVLLEALLHILTDLDSMTDFDVFLKGKATEGLQNLLVLDDSLQRCVTWLTKEKNYNVPRFLSSLRDVTHVAEDQRLYGRRCSYESIVDITIFKMNNIAVSAAEILLSVLDLSLQQYESDSTVVPICYVVSTCIEFLQYNDFTNQHVLYLTVHLICREHKEIFFSIVQTYPELLSSLAALLLWDNDMVPFTTHSRLILMFLIDLVQICPSIRTVIVRQVGVLEAITHIAHFTVQDDAAKDESTKAMAAKLLFTLSYDVFNRRLMARQTYLLSSMIRFVRGIDVDASTSNTSGNPSPEFHREAMKQRISQLVAVL